MRITNISGASKVKSTWQYRYEMNSSYVQNYLDYFGGVLVQLMDWYRLVLVSYPPKNLSALLVYIALYENKLANVQTYDFEIQLGKIIIIQFITLELNFQHFYPFRNGSWTHPIGYIVSAQLGIFASWNEANWEFHVKFVITVIASFGCDHSELLSLLYKHSSLTFWQKAHLKNADNFRFFLVQLYIGKWQIWCKMYLGKLRTPIGKGSGFESYIE